MKAKRCIGVDGHGPIMGQSIGNEDKVGKETETFSVGQAADFLQTHPDTLKARARTGEIKGDKPGRR